MAQVQEQTTQEKFLDLETCDKVSTTSTNCDNDSAFSDENHKNTLKDSVNINESESSVTTEDIPENQLENQLENQIETNETEDTENLTENIEKIHQLHSTWTMWLKNGNIKNSGDSCTWDQGLDEIFTFNTVNDFWSLYHHIQTPSNVRHKMDYLMFRNNVQPKWEDKMNKEGGMWKLVIPKEKRKTVLDLVWLETLLSVIGESYGDATDYIMGVCIQRRQREDRLQVWLTEANDDIVKLIGETLKTKTLNLTSETKLYYLKHADQYLNNESWKVQANKSARFTV